MSVVRDGESWEPGSVVLSLLNFDWRYLEAARSLSSERLEVSRLVQELVWVLSIRHSVLLESTGWWVVQLLTLVRSFGLLHIATLKVLE